MSLTSDVLTKGLSLLFLMRQKEVMVTIGASPMQMISREDVVRARSARCLWNLGAKAALALSYLDPLFSSSFPFKRNGRLKVKMTKVTETTSGLLRSCCYL